MDYEFRLLTHDDYEEVKEMCKDIWDGTDYMPLVFHDWVDDEKGEFLSFEDFGEKGKPLFFGKDTHGSGFILWRDCGFEQKITSYLHNLPRDIRMTTWTGGYQCQLCGKFQARKSTPQKRDIDLNCECGGMISNKEPIFCPKCKSLDLEYHCTIMT